MTSKSALLTLAICVGACHNMPEPSGTDLGTGGGPDLVTLPPPDGGGPDLSMGGGGPDLGMSAADMSMQTTAQAACNAEATAWCQKLSGCDQNHLVGVYGDVATCVTRRALDCPLRLMAAGTTETPATVMACATAEAAASCWELLQNNPPMACRPAAGPLANFKACGASAQCQSGYCHIVAGMACGACEARAPLKGSCTDDGGCQYGLVCTAGQCVAPAAMGAACSASQPCQFGMGCGTGKCGPYLDKGAACKLGYGCDVPMNQFCDPATKTCEQYLFAKAGEPCGNQMAGQTLCQGGDQCQPDAIGDDQGHCVAPVADGGKCSTIKTDYKFCQGPEVCLNTTCKLPDPTTCK